MGRVGDISSDLPRKAGGRGVRPARISEKDTGHKSARPGRRARTTRTPSGSAPVASSENAEAFASVWEALGFYDGEAANLEARSALMMQIENIIRSHGWTQAQAAKQCRVTQPRMSELLRGHIDRFSLDALVNIAAALGRRVRIELDAA